MVSKNELLKVICKEFAAAQNGEAEPWIPSPDTLSFPPLLPVGNGKHLAATNTLLEAIRNYASSIRDNSTALRASFTIKEFGNLVRVAFGRTLDTLGSTVPDPSGLGPAVDVAIDVEIKTTTRKVEVLVGCWLVQDTSAYPIKVGPVTFDLRLDWLEKKKSALSKTTHRRLKNKWSGQKLRSRKSSSDQHHESAIEEAVDRCPVVCEIETHGLSSDLIETKGLLGARLAIAALALLWGNPASALEDMRLTYDGPPYRRRYATIYESGGFGSSTSWVNRSSGQYSTDPLKPFVTDFEPTLELIGEALTAYLKPLRSVSRPRVYNSLFLSIWWFHEGCREESDQMAVTAFAASLDALAAGRKAQGIKRLIEARLGFKATDALMKDGRTVNAVIDRVYDGARSRFIHGSSIDFGEDWTELRGTAQAVARLLLVRVTYWLHKNSAVSDMKAMQTK